MAELTAQLQMDLAAYIEGTAEAAQAQRVQELLAHDPALRVLVDGMMEDRRQLRALPRPTAPPELTDQILSRIERGSLLGGMEHELGSTSQRWWLGRAAAALAAALLVAAFGYFVVRETVTGHRFGEGKIALAPQVPLHPPGVPARPAGRPVAPLPHAPQLLAMHAAKLRRHVAVQSLMRQAPAVMATAAPAVKAIAPRCNIVLLARGRGDARRVRMLLDSFAASNAAFRAPLLGRLNTPTAPLATSPHAKGSVHHAGGTLASPSQPAHHGAVAARLAKALPQAKSNAPAPHEPAKSKTAVAAGGAGQKEPNSPAAAGAAVSHALGGAGGAGPLSARAKTALKAPPPHRSFSVVVALTPAEIHKLVAHFHGKVVWVGMRQKAAAVAAAPVHGRGQAAEAIQQGHKALGTAPTAGEETLRQPAAAEKQMAAKRGGTTGKNLHAPDTLTQAKGGNAGSAAPADSTPASSGRDREQSSAAKAANETSAQRAALSTRPHPSQAPVPQQATAPAKARELAPAPVAATAAARGSEPVLCRVTVQLIAPASPAAPAPPNAAAHAASPNAAVSKTKGVAAPAAPPPAKPTVAPSPAPPSSGQ